MAGCNVNVTAIPIPGTGTPTIPTPATYDPDDPLKNLADLAYVVMQLLTIAKAANVKLGGTGDLMETIESFSGSVLAAAGYRTS